jgi:hypothetical protein
MSANETEVEGGELALGFVVQALKSKTVLLSFSKSGDLQNDNMYLLGDTAGFLFSGRAYVCST